MGGGGGRGGALATSLGKVGLKGNILAVIYNGTQKSALFIKGTGRTTFIIVYTPFYKNKLYKNTRLRFNQKLRATLRTITRLKLIDQTN